MTILMEKQTRSAKRRKTAAAIGLMVLIAVVVYMIAVAKDQWLSLAITGIALAGFFVVNRNSALKKRISDTWKGENRALLITGILLAILVPFPLRTDPYLLHVFVMIGISIILALGLNFQVGSTGIPNLGFAAFYGVGAYASALLAINFKLDFWITIFLGALVSAFFGFLVGLPSLKTRTYHLALVSIAFGLVVYIMLNNLDFTGGPNGVKDIPAPAVLGVSLFKTPVIFGVNYPMQLNFYFLVLFFIAITLIVANALYHSKIGLYWNAVREDEIAAKCSGINVSSVKILAFCVGAFFAGIAGALYAHYIGYISPENFNMNVSLLILGMVIMGGMDNIAGACVGAFILTMAPEKFRSLADFRMVATGLILILMLIFRPSGIIPQSIRRYAKILSRKNTLPGGQTLRE